MGRNLEKRKVYQNKYNQDNKEKRSAYSREYYWKNREEIQIKKKKYDKVYHKKNKESLNFKSKTYYYKNKDRIRSRYQKIRLSVINLYGGKCACCGETKIEFLSIDHIHGGGTQHRKEIGHSVFYAYILKEGYNPDKYRILCHNCNQSFGFYGYCPHNNIISNKG